MSNKILIVMTFWPNASYIQRIIRSFLFFTLQLYVVYQIFASMVKIIVFLWNFFKGRVSEGGLGVNIFRKISLTNYFPIFSSCIVWRGKLFRQMKCPIPLSIDLKHVLNVCCSTKWNFQGNSTQIHKFSSYYLRSTDLKNHPWQRKISAGKSKFLKK